MNGIDTPSDDPAGPVPAGSFGVRGRGAAMVRAGTGWLREHGAVKVQLMVRSSNEGVVSFYESLGFEEQEVTVLGRRLSP